MATSVLRPDLDPVASQPANSGGTYPRRLNRVVVTLLTFLAIGIEGYHPYAEDGGLYAAGIERLLDPSLFPHWSSFVLAPMRVSIFAPFIAVLIRITHIGLPGMLLVVHIASIWCTLYAASAISAFCWNSQTARTGAVVLLACWLGLPIAGTSLQFIDPYVTARSFSTPCAFLALLGVLRLTTAPGSDRRKALVLCVASLSLAIAMHPLMGGYALAAALLLGCFRSQLRIIRLVGPIALGAAAVVLAATLQHTAPPESKAYVDAALTRGYWFPSSWQWYELAGLAGPVAVLAAYTKLDRRGLWADRSTAPLPARTALVQMAIALAIISAFVAVAFARPAAPIHLVARLQPLRAFLIIYGVMILILGAVLGEYLLRNRLRRWSAAVLLFGGIIFFAEFQSYPASRHIQIPGFQDANPWMESFAWVRTHTPKDALFALEPDYIHAPGEDGYCFRAVAERSALPDFSKDGGEASIAPDLAAQWQSGLSAQNHLNSTASQVDRYSAYTDSLRAMGVSWVILRASTATNLPCPYTNVAAKVCRIV